MKVTLAKDIDYKKLPRRDILCIDVKGFFASVEAARRGIDPLEAFIIVMSNPELPGGLVLAASPKVKEVFGYKTGTRRFEITDDPRLMIVEPHMKDYIIMNDKVNKILRRYTDDTNWFPYSIDESFIDVTGSHSLFGDNLAIAFNAQQAIYRELGLAVAIGIGDNPLLAKLALDNEAKNNPFGIATWTYETINKIHEIPTLTDMWGIGHKTAKKLDQMNIKTVKQLAEADPYRLHSKFGVLGLQLFYHAHGVDYSILSERYVPKSKSYGKSQILDRDYLIQYEIEVVIREMADQVASRLRDHKSTCAVIHLAVGNSKNEINKGFSQQVSLSPTNQSKEIIEQCLRIFRKNYKDEAVRSIAISASKIAYQESIQLNLFESPIDTLNKKQLDETVDKVRNKYGYSSLVHASSLTAGGKAIARSKLVGGHRG